MRRHFFCLALLTALIVGGATSVKYHTAPPAPHPALAVLSNGAVIKIADGLYSYRGVDTLRGPQCVELAERFYVTKYPGTFPYHNSGPGAYDIWDAVANGKNVGGWSHYRTYFVAYDNGITMPQADDMLLYDRSRGDGWGHIALIVEVHPDAIVILEQNNHWDTRRVLPLIGNQIIDRGVKGVIRLKSRDQPQSNSAYTKKTT